MDDTPMHRKSIDELTVDQCNVYLEVIRKNRLIITKKYEAGVMVSDEVREGQLRKKFDKNIAMFNKEAATVERNIVKLEKRVTILRALAMEHGVFIDPMQLEALPPRGTDGEIISNKRITQDDT